MDDIPNSSHEQFVNLPENSSIHEIALTETNQLIKNIDIYTYISGYHLMNNIELKSTTTWKSH